jgi:glycosyltransferase involved in cell wall biosynthesis
MNIIHVTSWLSRQGGGIPPVVWALARETRRRGHACSVLGLEDEWVKTDCAASGVPFTAGRVRGPRALGFSPALNAQLRASAGPGAVIHSHGLWMHPGTAARRCAGRQPCPLIVSPHGMLEPWALNRSRWKKKLAAWWFEDGNLRRADCLHALSPAEAESFRRYGLKKPIAIIPNGVDLVEDRGQGSEVGGRRSEVGGQTGEAAAHCTGQEGQTTEAGRGQPDGRRVVLFLSRLHPKKGLANLLQAWRRVARDFPDWCLVIAGAGEPAYEQELQALGKQNGLEPSVIFAGPLYGGDKQRVLAGADVFVLPSFSEGFSMAILEAAAAGLPVLLTPECNFSELAKAGAAVAVSAQAPAIESGLRRLLELSDEQRQAMGLKAIELVRQSYTWPAIADRMHRVYEWMAGNGSRPEDVVV